jgi:hypothetical protein
MFSYPHVFFLFSFTFLNTIHQYGIQTQQQSKILLSRKKKWQSAWRKGSQAGHYNPITGLCR